MLQSRNLSGVSAKVVGEVVRLPLLYRGEDAYSLVEVERVWKGEVSQQTRVYTDNSLCGLFLTPRHEYLIYATTNPAGNLYIWQCGRTGRVSAEDLAADMTSLGKSYAPLPNADSDAPMPNSGSASPFLRILPWLGMSCLLMVVLLAGAVFGIIQIRKQSRTAS